MKATLTIIRGGKHEPSAVLSIDSKDIDQAQHQEISRVFNDWWNTRGGVLLVSALDLSVVSIDLDVSGDHITILPR